MRSVGKLLPVNGSHFSRFPEEAPPRPNSTVGAIALYVKLEDVEILSIDSIATRRPS